MSLSVTHFGIGGTRIRASVQALSESNVADLIDSYRDTDLRSELDGFADGVVAFASDDQPFYSAFVDDRYDISLRLEATVGGEDYENDKAAMLPRPRRRSFGRSSSRHARCPDVQACIFFACDR